ncbi:Protein of unknown function (DUF3636) domain containing protein [Naviculisporaceae sp. PSN 640]
MDLDDYSDDGFDDLNDNVLQELENNAIQLTQAQKLVQSQAPAPPGPVPQRQNAPPQAPVRQQYQQQQQQPPNQQYRQFGSRPQLQPQAQAQPQPQPEVYDLTFDDDDLDDTVVIDELAPPPRPATGIENNVPPQPARIVPSLAGQQRWNQQVQASRSGYTPRPQYPQHNQQPARVAPPPLPSQRYLRPPVPPTGIPIRPSQAHQQSQFVRPPVPSYGRPYPAQPSQAPHFSGAGQQNDITAALQARLSALEAELTAAKGEASILRSKYEKANQTHDAEIARLKKQNAEQLAKQERVVEAALAAEKTAATELQFARQDLRAELGRAKSKKKDGATTPRKSKNWGQPDGFDGVEILSSPSKGQAQRRRDSSGVAGALAVQGSERSPSKGKRKRSAIDSPSFALETHSDDTSSLRATEPKKSTAPRIVSDTLPFDFLRLVLDHSPLHGQPLTFDLFSRFAFPTQPNQSFAATIFQKLPEMGSPQEPLRLLVDFAELMIDMWRQCLSERYYSPIYYLAALVSYTLQLNAAAVAPHIISSLVPVCSTTCQLVALPRFNSVDGNISDHPDSVVRQLLLDIDVTQSLSILYIAALGCLNPTCSSDDTTSQGPNGDVTLPLQYSPQTEFWKAMELEFVMMMLHPKHPEVDWFGMLSLLWTSVLPTSIGPIPNPATSATHFANGRPELETLEFAAFGIIDRVSSFLVEPPRWVVVGTEKDLVIRLSILKTLILFATSDFGVVHLARSDVALPRLVTVLCWGIDKLYDAKVPYLSPQPASATEQITGGALEQIPGAGDPVPVLDADLMQLDPPARHVGDAGSGAEENSNGEEEENDNTKVPGLLLSLISQAILLLHTLVTGPRTANLANITAKLAAAQGASHRYLITLTRLNFAEEELVLERGIDAETVELAHELLELAMTPDEGESVGELFGL